MAALMTHEEDAQQASLMKLADRSTTITIHSVRFSTAIHEARELGFDLSILLKEALVSTIGETTGYAVVACVRKESLEDPTKFAEAIVRLFGFSGRTILNSLGEFVQEKVSRRQESTK